MRLLRLWRMQSGERDYVLPHGGRAKPGWPKSAWGRTQNTSEIPIIPQGLRQNFCEIAASMGVPPAIAALWQGHGSDVAEDWYRDLSLDRLPGASDFEEAMGLDGILDRMIEEATGAGSLAGSAGNQGVGTRPIRYSSCS